MRGVAHRVTKDERQTARMERRELFDEHFAKKVHVGDHVQGTSAFVEPVDRPELFCPTLQLTSEKRSGPNGFVMTEEERKGRRRDSSLAKMRVSTVQRPEIGHDHCQQTDNEYLEARASDQVKMRREK